MNEKSADILDQGNAVTEFLTEAAVSLQRAAAQPEFHPDFDGSHCVEEGCGADIPAERLELGKVRCVDCQAVIEKARSAFRR